MKSTREKKGQNKSPCCVSWRDETQAVSHEKTRQGIYSTSCKDITLRYPKAKPRGQTMWTKRYKRYEKMYKTVQIEIGLSENGGNP
jgi:hypothetical protein